MPRPATQKGAQKPTAPSASAAPRESLPPRHRCERCGHTTATRSGITKHQKTCGVRDRSTCQFCGKTFESFLAVRCHERTSHPLAYNKEAESQLAMNDAVLYTKMAEIETSVPKGTPFMNKMVMATGLTRDQIRHRRSKPMYEEYLQLARRNKASRLSLSQTTPSEVHPAASAPPTCGTPDVFVFTTSQEATPVEGPREPEEENKTPSNPSSSDSDSDVMEATVIARVIPPSARKRSDAARLESGDWSLDILQGRRMSPPPKKQKGTRRSRR